MRTQLLLTLPALVVAAHLLTAADARDPELVAKLDAVAQRILRAAS